jgi:hypothetical protein
MTRQGHAFAALYNQLAAVTAERDKLRAFVRELVENRDCALEATELQDLAVKHGIFEEMVENAMGETIRLTPLVTGEPEKEQAK